MCIEDIIGIANSLGVSHAYAMRNFWLKQVHKVVEMLGTEM